MEELLNFFTANQIEIIGVLLTLLITIFLFNRGNTFSFTKEQYSCLILPLFKELEPYLYQPDYKECLYNALNIIDKNDNLASWLLIEIYKSLKANPNDLEAYLDLCSYVDLKCDLCCIQLNLGIRWIPYRLLNHQYRNNTHKILLYVVAIVLLAVFGTSFIVLVTALSMIFDNYFNML